MFSAIITIKGSEDGYKTQKHVHEKIGILPTIFVFDGVKSKHQCDRTHDLSRNHINVAKIFLNSNHEYALIFEDDARFFEDRDIKRIYKTVCDKINDLNFDIIFLGCEPLGPIWKVSKHIYKVPFANDTHAYILSRKGAKKFTNYYDKIPFSKKDDKLCFGDYGSMNQLDFRYAPFLKNYTIKPAIAYQYKCPTFHSRYISNCKHSTIIDMKMIFSEYMVYVFYFLCIIIIVNKIKSITR